MSNWTCLACGHDNDELAEACDAQRCGLDTIDKKDRRHYTQSPCCGEWVPVHWQHPRVDGCFLCMDTDDYIRRIQMFGHVRESTNWMLKHAFEVEQRDDCEDIFEIYSTKHAWLTLQVKRQKGAQP